jgi:predicted nicotinamide N-methyase
MSSCKSTKTIINVDDLIAYIPTISVRGSGGMLWPAARVLATYICAGHLDITGNQVLELGSGTHALPGLASLLCGAKKVVITDVPLVAIHHVDAISVNSKLISSITSASSTSIHSAAFLFGSNMRRSLGADSIFFDFILIADVISLDESLYLALRKTLLDASHINKNITIIFSTRERSQFEQLFWKGLIIDGWDLVVRHREPCLIQDGDTGSEDIEIIAATRQKYALTVEVGGGVS